MDSYALPDELAALLREAISHASKVEADTLVFGAGKSSHDAAT